MRQRPQARPRAAARLAPETLAQVRTALSDGEPLSAAEVADRTGIARVTARRYLEYLVAADEATCSSAADGPGRPAKAYALSFARA